VAGVLSLFFEDQVLPYYGGALHEALPYAVNDFMYWELTPATPRGSGAGAFDFGRSREVTGAYHFKRHLGLRAGAACRISTSSSMDTRCRT